MMQESWQMLIGRNGTQLCMIMLSAILIVSCHQIISVQIVDQVDGRIFSFFHSTLSPCTSLQPCLLVWCQTTFHTCIKSLPTTHWSAESRSENILFIYHAIHHAMHITTYHSLTKTFVWSTFKKVWAEIDLERTGFIKEQDYMRFWRVSRRISHVQVEYDS